MEEVKGQVFVVADGAASVVAAAAGVAVVVVAVVVVVWGIQEGDWGIVS